MSSNLRCEPAVRETVGLPYALKAALRKRWGEPVQRKVSETDRPYLEGLQDAGVEGADVLLEQIEKHGLVSVWEEY